ncbi:MAG: hypothetical protein ACRD35_08720 [Candidatus Acidiferrales bacterium]
MTKSHQTFRKRQRERAVRDKAQRKRERREQRRVEKKDSPLDASDLSSFSLHQTEAEPPADNESEDPALPPTDN